MSILRWVYMLWVLSNSYQRDDPQPPTGLSADGVCLGTVWNAMDMAIILLPLKYRLGADSNITSITYYSFNQS